MAETVGDPLATAYSDIAASVETWAATQIAAIVRAPGETLEERRAAWDAHAAFVAEQTQRILIALMAAQDPVGWEGDRDVGWTLGEVAKAARTAAASLGWVPRRRQVSTATRIRVYRRDGYACAECGQDDVRLLVLDHRIPVALGGTNDPDNLRTLCAKCNGEKGAEL